MVKGWNAVKRSLDRVKDAGWPKRRNRNDISSYAPRQETRRRDGRSRDKSKNKKDKLVRAEMEEERLALDQIWRFSKFFVAKCWWDSEVLLEVSPGPGGWKPSHRRMNRQEQTEKICSDVIQRSTRWCCIQLMLFYLDHCSCWVHVPFLSLHTAWRSSIF